jgi:hypothetical protein
MGIIFTIIATAIIVDRIWVYRMRKFIKESNIANDKLVNEIEEVYKKEIDRLKAERVQDAGR